MAQPVSVSVEAALENQIQEITYDGQEILVQPLSMSDNLSKLAHKIDFTNSGEAPEPEENIKQEDNQSASNESAIKNDVDNKQSVHFQPSLWPWDSMRNKLRSALTEICVLGDVLNIAREKRYMVLDQVSSETPEPRRVAQLMSKKKGLSAAAAILMNGTERMRSSQSEINRNRNSPDFHVELLHLRQNWRLKKLGTTILGDLSYRTAGSRFWNNGVFEVTKAEESSDQTPQVASVQQVNGASSQRTGALNVTVPSALEGVSYIQVTIQGDNDTLCSAHLSIPTPPNAINGFDNNWQQSLEAAQNVLFCKELFTQLAREAVQLQANIPHIVIGNQIIASLFPGIHLCIGLCHSANKEKSSVETPSSAQKTEHNHVLEHSLHQLLRELHYNNVHHPMPHPTTATLGISKRRRLAGPQAYDRYTLLEMTKSVTLLEQIIKQGQLFFIRVRTSYVIDSLAREIKDPLIVAHWNCLTSPTKTCVKINIMSHGYETICRTSLVLHIEPTSLKAICRDGRVIQLSYDPKELRDLIMCQIVQHQVQAVQSLSKLMSWQILASSNHVGVGPVEPLGNAASALLSSPSGDRLLALRYGTNSGIQVSIQSSPRKDFYTNNLVKDMKWQNLGGDFKEIRWEKMEGRNFINKMELLMASLTNII